MRHLPNALTLANLFCGCCALLYIFHDRLEWAAWFTAACFAFDYLDGMAARALRVSSPLGKELDSLADMVSFGVVPGALFYQMLALSFSNGVGVEWRALPAFLLTAFAALRLAKFNLDTRQAHYFIGLSTPACTVFVLGLALGVWHNRFGMAGFALNPWLLYGAVGLLSWLLVSEVPMFGMKIKKLDWASNRFLFLFLVLFALFVISLKELALSAIIVCYILFSVFFKQKITASAT